MQIARSKLDNALNIVKPQTVGSIETRYVDKGEYQVIYISSQTGCNHGCRFCHLTTSGQTAYEDVSRRWFLDQARTGLDHARDGRTLHFDYMARGEPLANPVLNSDTLLAMSDEAFRRGFRRVRHLISTIMPRRFVETCDLITRFPTFAPDIYYSLYTVDEDKRKHWMPNAAPAYAALLALKQWQDFTRKIPQIHFAVVPGLNDSEEAISNVCDYIWQADLRVNFNIIEYNPAFGPAEAKRIVREMLPESKVNLIPRIAPDVNVACGMFAS